MTIIIAIEGVLMTEKGDPIPEGLKLYRTLVPNYRVVVASDTTFEKASYWLKTNFVVGYADILDNTHAYPGIDLRERHIQSEQQKGRVEFLVEADADRCARGLAIGVPSLYFATPKFVRTKREIKRWDLLTEELAKQREQVADTYVGSNLHRWE
jgi:hypothetical protein